MIEAGTLISSLLVVLCLLAGLDLWRQLSIKSEASWQQHYMSAVQSDYSFWSLGFRLEDLGLKQEAQQRHLSSLLHHIDMELAPSFSLSRATLRHNIGNIEFTRQARISLHDMVRNDTRVFQIRCGVDGPHIRIGLNDFRTDERDQCQLFAAVTTKDNVDPHTMYDLIRLPEGAFALRSVANDRFVKSVPPPNDNPTAPWKLVIGGQLIGIAETFRLTEDGYLYSSLTEGYFTCSTGQMVSGYPGSYGSWNAFILEPVHRDDVIASYTLVDLSRKVSKIQRDYAEKKATEAKRVVPVTPPVATIVDKQLKICMAIPITSKGTVMKEVVDSPFWSNLFDSFMRSVDWRSNKYIFQFYLGFDQADPLYDTGDAWSDMREEFRHRAIFRMTEQMMTEEAINKVLDEQLSLKLMHFDHLQGAPSQVVSQLVLAAYAEHFDYFYQVNDDTVIETPNWAPKLVATLEKNPTIPNFGVTGPTDSNNNKIFTHSFVHRTHIDVFGHLFPTSFKNWWSDDWISTVYGSVHTLKCPDVIIKHNVQGQKTGELNRYQVDKSAQFYLEDELKKGHAQIDEWLKKHSYPRLPLPEICEYIPGVRWISSKLGKKSEMAPQ